MGFINEKISKAERESINERNLKYLSHKLHNPIFRTIDHELGIQLFACGVMTKDDPEEKVFFLEWKEKYFFLHVNLDLKETRPDEVLISWTEFEILSASDADYDRKMLIMHVKEALQVLEVFGAPKGTFPNIRETLLTFNFEF